jgi:hypothetical protein
MLLYSDIISEDEMFSDAFPVSALRPSARDDLHANVPLQQTRGRYRLRGRLSDDDDQRRC